MSHHDRPLTAVTTLEVAVKQFACGDVVPGCTRLFRGTESEILDAVSHHARADHGLGVLPDPLREQVRDHMVLVA